MRSTLLLVALSLSLLAAPARAVDHEIPDLAPLFEINEDTVDNYCYNNGALIKGPVKAVAIDFQGLSYQALKKDADPIDTALAEKNILVVQPWLGPWNWSNFFAIRSTDRIVEAAMAKYGVAKNAPVVIYGRSMGGVSIYNYAIYGKFPVKGIAGNCPVTDLHMHATERPDLPRSFYRAFGGYDCGVPMAVYLHCPMCQIDRLPDVPYQVISSDADASVSKTLHALPFVEALKEKNYKVEYIDVPGMEHVQFDKPGEYGSYPDVLKKYIDFIIACAG